MLNTFLKHIVGKKSDDMHPIRNRYLCVFDIIFAFIAYVVSAELVFAEDAFGKIAQNAFTFDTLFMVLSTTVVFILILYIFDVYSVMWSFGGTNDYLKLVSACIIASLSGLVISELVVDIPYHRVPVVALVIESFAVIAARMCIRAGYSLYKQGCSERISDGTRAKKLLIIGAGTAGINLLKDIRENPLLNYDVVGFIDGDTVKRKMKIDGKEILGDRHDIIRICKEYGVDEIVIAIPSISAKEVNDIYDICSQTKCITKIIPGMDKIIKGESLHKQIRNVQIEDLLERDPIKLNNEKIEKYITGKTVLVTGGGGSIGSELCRQIMRYEPEKLIIVDIYENNAYDIQMELNRKYPDNKPEVIIASVRDKSRLEDIFDKYRPYIVFHAVAHKHVPLMEAIKNNVFGTLNTAECADKFGVSKFILISTDKAVNPTNVMGATKRICEMIIQYMQQKSKTTYVAVRFGNVLGSNGSVIPLFKKQIEEGGPVTVTDKRITRFFMTIPEAAQLVLQAASYANGGEIFVLDMGEPVKIYDLAKNIIKLSGMIPDKDIKIEVCGLRPGEKLYEELLMDEEGLKNTEHKKIFIGKPIDIEYEKLKQMLNVLEEAAQKSDVEYIKDLVAEVVPTYVRKTTSVV